MSSANHHTSESRSVFDAGFDIHPIQLRAAIATPASWQDALVVSASANGSIVVRNPFDGSENRLWNHADNTSVLAKGDPVVVHSLYGVLAAGELYLSVAVLA